MAEIRYIYQVYYGRLSRYFYSGRIEVYSDNYLWLRIPKRGEIRKNLIPFFIDIRAPRPSILLRI